MKASVKKTVRGTVFSEREDDFFPCRHAAANEMKHKKKVNQGHRHQQKHIPMRVGAFVGYEKINHPSNHHIKSQPSNTDSYIRFGKR